MRRRRPAELHHDRAAKMGDQPEVPRKQVQVGAITLAEERFGAAHRPTIYGHKLLNTANFPRLPRRILALRKVLWIAVPTGSLEAEIIREK